MVKQVPAEEIARLAEEYREDMVSFLRDMVRIPSESGQEKGVAERIKVEMEKCGFDEVEFDGLGNVIGRIGNGPTILAMDGHVDTVGVGDRSMWKWDPYEGKVENGIVYGRGAGDQEGAMPAMVYAGKIIKELGLEDEYTLYVVGSVMEEDCDGIAWLYIVNEDKIKPECVVVTDSTNCNIYRGHRGRMEIQVKVRGRSCHGSAPERGINAIYKMTPIIQGIEQLNDRLKHDDFLGKGTITVSQIFFEGPSQCAVPDSCMIHIDRRLTAGETKESALAEIAALPGAEDAEITVPIYEGKAWTGNTYTMEKYFPTWVYDEDHIGVRTTVDSYKQVLKREPKVDRWTFSTNGVTIAGVLGIPCVGFGPAPEETAHSVDDQVPIQQIVDAAKVYAAWPLNYLALKNS